MPTDSLILRGKEVGTYTSGVSLPWTATGGVLYFDLAATSLYDGTSSLSNIYFKASNNVFTGSVVQTGTGAASYNPIAITPSFPLVPHFPHEWKTEKRGVVFLVKRDGSRTGKIHGSGVMVRDFKLAGRNRTKAEITEVEDLFNLMYPFKQFWYEDKWITGHAGLYVFDSQLTLRAEGIQHGSFDVAISQVG